MASESAHAGPGSATDPIDAGQAGRDRPPLSPARRWRPVLAERLLPGPLPGPRHERGLPPGRARCRARGTSACCRACLTRMLAARRTPRGGQEGGPEEEEEGAGMGGGW